MWSDLARVLRAAVVDVGHLVLPIECPGCGLWDVALCPACGGAFERAPRRCEWQIPRLDRMDGRLPLPVWTVTEYAGPTRGVVVGWKDRGRVDLTAFMVGAIRAAAAALGPVLAAAGLEQVDVVPVPTTASARRRRGADLVGLLAAGAAAGLRAGGLSAESMSLLRRPGARDQVGLGARARGGIKVLLRRPAGGRCALLVDDVVTTGSTLAACEQALSGSGAVVVGAVVLAATPPPGGSRSGVSKARYRPGQHYRPAPDGVTVEDMQ